MRQSAILNNEYEEILLREAKKTGLIASKYDFSSMFDNYNEIAEAENFYDSFLDRKVEERKNLFRSILLFDEIILPHASDLYSYDLLEKQGCFKIISFDDFYRDTANSFRGESGKRDYIFFAKTLKPAILPVVEDMLRTYFRIIPDGIDYKGLISSLYDYCFEKTVIPQKYERTIEINKAAFDNRHSEYYKKAKQLHAPDIVLKPKRFFTDICGIIITCYEDLSWQLHISSSNNSAIINCGYNLADIGCTDFSEDAELASEAYKILRVECGKMIGTFPEVNSIQEVMQIKEKRHSDLMNLRQELSHLEYEIKNGSKKSTVEKAANDVAKASKAFSKGNKICEVNKWLSTFTVGMSAAFLYTHDPIFEIGSFSLGTALSVGLAYGEKVKAQGNWMGIIF